MPGDDVLLVDGDPCALGVMAHGLARRGLQVRSVAKSDQALQELSRTLPSLVISDVEKGGADGLGLLSRMRSDPRTADIPVLLLSKGDWKGQRSEAQRLGAQDLLGKPLFVQDLAVLGRLYAGHAAAEEVLSGQLEDLHGVALLRGLLAGGRSGQLSIDPAGGRVYFHEGRVIDAVLPPLHGERAVWRLLTFEQGRYRVRFGDVDRQPTLAIDADELRRRGGEHVRGWEQLRAALGSTDAILEVDFKRLSSRLDRVAPAVLPLVRLFDGQRNVGQVIDACGLDDLLAARAIIKLNSMELLRPAGESAPIPVARPLPAATDPGAPVQVAAVPSGNAEADSLEASFFGPPEASLDAEGPLPEFAPRLPRLGRRVVIPVVGVAVAGLALAFVLRSPAPEPSVPAPAVESAPVAAPAPAPGPIAAAPTSLAELPPPPVTADRGPEAEALIQEGQKAYDARQFARAEESFQKAAALAPGDPTALMYLGLSQYELGQLGQAVESLQKALSLDPQNSRTELLLGATYQELGKKDRARESYERYLALDPNGEYGGEVRTILDALPGA